MKRLLRLHFAILAMALTLCCHSLLTPTQLFAQCPAGYHSFSYNSPSGTPCNQSWHFEGCMKCGPPPSVIIDAGWTLCPTDTISTTTDWFNGVVGMMKDVQFWKDQCGGDVPLDPCPTGTVATVYFKACYKHIKKGVSSNLDGLGSCDDESGCTVTYSLCFDPVTQTILSGGYSTSTSGSTCPTAPSGSFHNWTVGICYDIDPCAFVWP